MSKLLRRYSPGRVYFVTAVTHQRAPLLIENRDLFRLSIKKVRPILPFDLIAWVLLPDHLHLIIDPGAFDLSNLMQQIKLSFAFHTRRRIGLYRGKIWQSRFWDHIIRDQEDMNRHIDYIHYNPVKHGRVQDPFAWEPSSIHKYQEKGFYPPDWGRPGSMKMDGDFGE